MNFNQVICGYAARRRFEMSSAQVVIADPRYYNVLLEEDWDTQWKAMGEYLEWTE
jgi:DNA modification methylase